jgi:hypothetical protein
VPIASSKTRFAGLSTEFGCHHCDHGYQQGNDQALDDPLQSLHRVATQTAWSWFFSFHTI